MTPAVIAIVVAFFAAALYAYVVFPVWVAVACATETALSKRAKTLWLIACIVLAPVGSWAYCMLTPVRRHFRVTAWLSLAGTVALAWFVTDFTFAAAAELRLRISELGPRVQRVQMAVDGARRAEISENLLTMRDEVRGGVLAFKHNDAISAALDLLDLYMIDGRLTATESEDWTERFKTRRVLDAGALERKVQAALGDSG